MPRVKRYQPAIDRALIALEPNRQEDPNAEPKQHLVDLLADLRHWAAANKVDFADALRIADNHFTDEG